MLKYSTAHAFNDSLFTHFPPFFYDTTLSYNRYPLSISSDRIEIITNLPATFRRTIRESFYSCFSDTCSSCTHRPGEQGGYVVDGETKSQYDDVEDGENENKNDNNEDENSSNGNVNKRQK